MAKKKGTSKFIVLCGGDCIDDEFFTSGFATMKEAEDMCLQIVEDEWDAVPHILKVVAKASLERTLNVETL